MENNWVGWYTIETNLHFTVAGKLHRNQPCNAAKKEEVIMQCTKKSVVCNYFTLFNCSAVSICGTTA